MDNKFELVSSILLKDWPPLNIGQNPHLADEYDDFVPRIIEAVSVGFGVHDLTALLRRIEEVDMGGGAIPRDGTVAAQKILEALGRE